MEEEALLCEHQEEGGCKEGPAAPLVLRDGPAWFRSYRGRANYELGWSTPRHQGQGA